MQESNFLEPDSRRSQQNGQAVLQRRLYALISEYGACSNCLSMPGGKDEDTVSYVDLPLHNMFFDGKHIHRVDYTDYVQGVGSLCID